MGGKSCTKDGIGHHVACLSPKPYSPHSHLLATAPPRVQRGRRAGPRTTKPVRPQGRPGERGQSGRGPRPSHPACMVIYMPNLDALHGMCHHVQRLGDVFATTPTRLRRLYARSAPAGSGEGGGGKRGGRAAHTQRQEARGAGGGGEGAWVRGGGGSRPACWRVCCEAGPAAAWVGMRVGRGHLGRVRGQQQARCPPPHLASSSTPPARSPARLPPPPSPLPPPRPPHSWPAWRPWRPAWPPWRPS